MSKVNRYEYEGKVIEIPLRWDEHSKNARKERGGGET